jgi:membrane-bound lytic murein transglycosylase D
MFRRLSTSTRGSRALLVLGVLLLAIEHGQPQTSETEPQAAMNDPFGAYHSSLAKAVDKALAQPFQHFVQAPRNDPDSSAVPMATNGAAVNAPAAAINRVQQLRPILEPILREERVPTELAAVVLVESGGQPNALSAKGARGIWQFMPDTARRYGLVVNQQRDERLDIQRSTRAAARYLRDLYRQFGDWQLTFAAYNAGEDQVQRAIERNGTKDFRLLSSGRSLPLETRRYVPAVVNALQSMGNASRFVTPVRNPELTWILYAQTTMATSQIDFEKRKEN